MKRSLRASARPIDLGDRVEGKRLSMLRQQWQGEAWMFRRSLGELRYATAYLGNAAQRMRIFVATTVNGEVVPVGDDPSMPIDIIAICNMALAMLGTGPTGIAPLLKLIMENFEVAGECFLVGTDDLISGVRTWKIRSTSETVTDPAGKIGFRDLPGAAGGQGSNDPNAVQWADPANTFVSRLWWPDPEFSNLADSPVKAVLDILEELLLSGRDQRATMRSRLANNGILAIPSELNIVPNHATATDEEAPTILDELLATASAALTDEGSSASVVPLLLEGPADVIDKIKHITIDRQNHKDGGTDRLELIGRLATGIDLPAEVLTGKVDINHWTAWQIDDDTFRHHIEPLMIVIVDALTQGYFLPTIEASGVDPVKATNLFLWYDPTELVTKPDRSKDAIDAFDRDALSMEALRTYLGFTEADAPTRIEILERIILKTRSIDRSIQEHILQRFDPTIPTSPPKPLPGAPVAPGAEPGTPGQPPTGGPVPPKPAIEGPPAGADGPPPTPVPPAAAGSEIDVLFRLALKHAVLELTAAGTPPAGAVIPLEKLPAVPADDRTVKVQAANRQLVDIDRRLRDRLIVAANQCVKTALSRAGAKIVSKSKTAAGASVRAAILDVPQWRIPFAVGPALRAAAGLDERTILDTSLSELKGQWDLWVRTGQDQAFRAAARIAGLDVSTAYAQVQGKFIDDAEAGWKVLEQSLRDRTTELLRVGPLDAAEDDIEFDAASSFVSAGMIRGALAVAGGFGGTPTSSGLGEDGYPVDPEEPMGQIGTGDTISGFLEDSGAQIEGYQWVHGPSATPFEPHEDLDGVIFASFTGEELGVPDGVSWGGDFWAPGDHAGCLCDFMPVWTTADEATDVDGG